MDPAIFKSVDTESLCPVCLARISAKRVFAGEDVFLEKKCPQHGDFRTLIWRGPPNMAGWHRPKIPAEIEHPSTAVEKGCPFDCGLCPDHSQRSCTVILEVTQRCNLACRFCFADAGDPAPDPSYERIARWFRLAKQFGGACNIQLSGGEPTLRDDLPELVALGRRTGFDFVQINTNGLRLAAQPEFARALKAAGAASVFLQFDGVDDDIYCFLRGRPLWEEKAAAVAACREAGLGVVLVPTLVPGVNDHAVGEILQSALRCYPTVRGVHFQPVSYFGRHPGDADGKRRLTLPEVMALMEVQTEGMIRADHFRPPGCEHSLCSFNGQYIVGDDGRLRPLNSGMASWRSESPIRAEEGAQRAINAVSRQWTNAPPAIGACSCSADMDWRNGGSLLSLDDFLSLAQQRTFSLSAMAFQDVWNLDLERVRQCCIHVMAADGRLIPFCLYNLTAEDGRRLYRP